MNGFIGEMKCFGGNFAPRDWAFCEGQLLSIAQYTALFSILGTTYGGDGRTTFSLPDLRGRSAIGPGTGAGLSTYRLGQKGGQEVHTLTVNEIPAHSHGMPNNATNGAVNQTSPIGHAFGTLPGADDIYNNVPATTSTAGRDVANAGGSQPHENRDPYLPLRWIICLQGIYPSRS